MASDVTARDEPAIERLEARPTGVDPSAIEAEFTRIWQETTAAGSDESTVRLRVLNFVGLGREGRDVDRFEEVMQALPDRHPCRGILALAAEGRGSLEATISAHCRTDGNRRHVCSEEVLLSGGLAQERELVSAVLPLLVPEVPVTAWIMGALVDDSYLAEETLEAADCVLFDSAATDAPDRAFRAALAMSEAHEVAMGDLAWIRLETWRTLAAQLFDGEDGPRELAQVREIAIVAGLGAGSSEGALLGGWFVSRLGLAMADVSREGDRLTATLYDRSRPVTLTLAPSGAAGTSAVTEVKIRTLDAEFIIAAHPESEHMHVRENWDGGSSRRTVERTASDDATTIGLALDGVKDGGVFEDALRTALLFVGP